MKRLLILLIPLFLLTSCLSDIASNMLYPYSSANSDDKVPENPPAPLQKIMINGADGHQTIGWLYQDKNPRAPVLIYFHGNGSNIQGEYAAGFFERVASFHLNVVVFDYPKYGLSTGELDEKGVLQAGQDVINFVKRKFPMSAIFIWGRSLGCAPATILTSTNQDVVRRLILTSPWDEFWRVVKNKVNLSDSTCKDAAKGNEYLSDVAAQKVVVPVLIHHGTKDTLVPFELGQHLSKSFASKNVTFIPIEGAGHNGLLGEKEWAQIAQFLRY